MDTNSCERREMLGNNYISVLSNQVTVDALRAFCLQGGLRTSNLRSIVWRNPWQQYFADHDLRDLISKDVGRTFPELEFFQQDHVRRMMCDILLIYAKENPFGMHEILAPLIFVLFSDQQSFSHCEESGGLKMLSADDCSILSHVYDPNYLENDSYAMFCEIMLELAKWYEDGSPAGSTSKPFDETGPYMRIQDAVPTSEIMRELSSIGQRLHAVDPVLSDHLRNFDIPPQFRWLRLLFGREFAIHDLLHVWDVILCDRPISRMVECVYVAMLVQIRHLLLQSDYGGCLQYLMRYPPVMDVSAFIQQALRFRNPKRYSSQSGTNPLGNFSHLTITGGHHPNRSRQEFLSSGKIVQDEAEMLLMEEQVACLQIKLNQKDIICSEAAQGIEWCVGQLRKGTEHTVSELCEKLMEIRRNITTDYPNGQYMANIPQPRHIQRENEMVDLRLPPTR
ncbi:unnamed protein product [Angiostrongylus costaricensis]|uniref:Rab-GAP TBC domain-containing protein n=1 Tax=Angiostrongylus costaricensis TaxID=334426 RepID=A0A158PL32_ANGCS|nr:unnamed protein product [Angiostrongylus costaricensis]